MNVTFKWPDFRSLTEIAIHAVVWITWILVLNAGTGNGIGFFHQPRHDLLWPLINGAVFNALVFIGNAFWLIPRFLAKRRFAAYLGLLAGLGLGVLITKTLAERVLILLAYPDLVDVPFHMLARENLWVLIAMLVLSTIYRIARDWLIGPDPEEEREKPPETVWIKSGTTREQVALDEILRVEACDNYVNFLTRSRKIMVLMTMKKALELLPSDHFMRIHRSHIIALDEVESATAVTVVVDDTSLPVGRTYRKRVRERLAKLANAADWHS